MEVFNNLSYVAKCDILRKHSHYIGSAIYYQYVIKLYSWDRFFIEQYYDTEEKIFTRITVATDKDMEKYLNSIDIVIN